LEPFEFAYLPRVRCTRIAPSTRSSHYCWRAMKIDHI
jgi:hypothetical protein